MNTIVDKEQLKGRIIAELNIGHLAEDEQEDIIDAVSEVLLKKATFEVMRRVPEAALDELDRLVETGDEAGMRALVRTHVPDIETVIADAARAGLDEHKRMVAELVAKEG